MHGGVLIPTYSTVVNVGFGKRITKVNFNAVEIWVLSTVTGMILMDKQRNSAIKDRYCIEEDLVSDNDRENNT